MSSYDDMMRRLLDQARPAAEAKRLERIRAEQYAAQMERRLLEDAVKEDRRIRRARYEAARKEREKTREFKRLIRQFLSKMAGRGSVEVSVIYDQRTWDRPLRRYGWPIGTYTMYEGYLEKDIERPIYLLTDGGLYYEQDRVVPIGQYDRLPGNESDPPEDKLGLSRLVDLLGEHGLEWG